MMRCKWLIINLIKNNLSIFNKNILLFKKKDVTLQP